jgi:hypothetical protein
MYFYPIKITIYNYTLNFEYLSHFGDNYSEAALSVTALIITVRRVVGWRCLACLGRYLGFMKSLDTI